MFTDNFKVLKPHALDAGAGRAKIEDQAKRQAGRAQIVESLRDVVFVNRFGALDFKQQHAFDQDVRDEVAHNDAIVKHLNWHLLLNM